jgi:uncharacterized protein (DUF433 family)
MEPLAPAPCPDCNGSGYKIVESEGILGAERCACAVQDRTRKLEEKANLAPRYQNKSFGNFQHRRQAARKTDRQPRDRFRAVLSHRPKERIAADRRHGLGQDASGRGRGEGYELFPSKDHQQYTETMDWASCSAVDRNPAKLGGVWCFKGTRLPVASLFEHLDQGATIDEFLEWFPDATREQVHQVLAFTKDSLEQPAQVA